VVRKAAEIYGSTEAAKRWLTTPMTHLDGQRPLDVLQEPDGAKRLEGLLVSLSYGEFF
jgi:putative toxin-antitoxin system antitoxin component (TIGR02293 family)